MMDDQKIARSLLGGSRGGQTTKGGLRSVAQTSTRGPFSFHTHDPHTIKPAKIRIVGFVGLSIYVDLADLEFFLGKGAVFEPQKIVGLRAEK